eukprot:TRINITY_DN3307_c0_g1_i2.p1 TRINITY_DN3307_c0_g1~~TRINITY_DN3307_c0_g1_i2.p1  ORF type:complete len:147 (-),score=22.18 TRINITY_DN3307_c0_g1_i2:116-502(-)
MAQENSCMSICEKELRAKGETVDAVIWHICHYRCGSEVSLTTPMVKETEQECIDACMKTKEADPAPIPVKWHQCKWGCEKQVSLFAVENLKDQKCWDDCEAEAKKTETNPSVIYQICFFKCGPKPSAH